MSDLKPYLLNQNKSVHHFQHNFFKQEPSPVKSHRKQLEQHGSPNHLSTSLSFSKPLTNKPQQAQSDTSYVYYLIQQIKQMEQTIQELKQENQLLRSQQKIGFLVLIMIILGFTISVEINDQISQFIKVCARGQIGQYNTKKNIEQMNLMMKIHLAPVNETLQLLNHPENTVIVHKESINSMQKDSINESTPNVKIHANISKYQKCKTETQFKDQK